MSSPSTVWNWPRIPVARASDLGIRSSQQSFGRDECVVVTVIKCGCHLQYVIVMLLFTHGLPMFGLGKIAGGGMFLFDFSNLWKWLNRNKTLNPCYCVFMVAIGYIWRFSAVMLTTSHLMPCKAGKMWFVGFPHLGSRFFFRVMAHGHGTVPLGSCYELCRR